MRFTFLLLSFTLLFISNETRGQNFLSWAYADRYFSISAGTGQTTYLGELNKTKFRQGFSHGTAGLEVRLLNRIGAKAEIYFYNIRGNDRYAGDKSFRKQRNLSFTSNNFESDLLIVYYFKEYQGDYYRRWKFDPYLMFGYGFTTYNPMAKWDGDQYELRELQLEGKKYENRTSVIPLTLGIKFKINEFLNFNVELAYRYTFTDYLDDVSGVYKDHPDNLTAALLSNRKDDLPDIVNQKAYDRLIVGGKRGNPDNNDSYLHLSFKLEAYLPRGNGGLLKKSTIK